MYIFFIFFAFGPFDFLLGVEWSSVHIFCHIYAEIQKNSSGIILYMCCVLNRIEASHETCICTNINPSSH